MTAATARRSRFVLLILASLAMLVGGCKRPSGKPWFERWNPDVQEGIVRLARHDAPGALVAFDKAAASHPSSPEVAFDRGLALLAANRQPEAREAFVRATGADATPALRAEALYNLGLSHHTTAIESATGEDREATQAAYRDAIEAYKRSLRTRPGRADVAWNLEIAMRSLADEERQEEQEQQEQQNQQNQDQQNQDQQNQDQQNQDQQNQDQQNQDQQNQDQQNQDQQQPQNSQDQQANAQNPPQPNSPQGQNPPQPSPSDPTGQQPPPSPPSSPQQDSAAASRDAAESLAPESRAMLDALDRGEGSLEAERARVRAAQERRRITQDW